MTRPTPTATATPAPAFIRLLLPTRADPPIPCLLVGADGAIRSRELLDPRRPSAPATTSTSADTMHCVLAIPGEEVRSLWLELPARNEAQAVAAARLLLDEHLAGAGDDLHVVVAPAQEGDARRQVLYVESAALQRRLDEAHRLGLEVDAAVPDYMLLPTVGEGDDADAAVQVLALDGRWQVRGPGLAFSGEAALAEAVLGAHPRTATGIRIVESADEVEAWLARGAVHPPVNLLQHRFARRDARPQGWSAWRRAAVLAGLLLLSPLLIVATGALRYALAASSLRNEAAETAAAFAGDAGNGADPVALLQEAVAAGASGDRFAHLYHALEAAATAAPDLQLERLEYDGNGALVVDLSHPADRDLAPLRDRLAGQGLQLEVRGDRDHDAGRVSTVLLRDVAMPAGVATEGTR